MDVTSARRGGAPLATGVGLRSPLGCDLHPANTSVSIFDTARQHTLRLLAFSIAPATSAPQAATTRRVLIGE